MGVRAIMMGIKAIKTESTWDGVWTCDKIACECYIMNFRPSLLGRLALRKGKEWSLFKRVSHYYVDVAFGRMPLWGGKGSLGAMRKEDPNTTGGACLAFDCDDKTLTYRQIDVSLRLVRQFEQEDADGRG